METEIKKLFLFRIPSYIFYKSSMKQQLRLGVRVGTQPHRIRTGSKGRGGGLRGREWGTGALGENSSEPDPHATLLLAAG